MSVYKIEIKAICGGTYSDYYGQELNDELAKQLAVDLQDEVWSMLHCDAEVTIQKCEKQ